MNNRGPGVTTRIDRANFPSLYALPIRAPPPVPARETTLPNELSVTPQLREARWVEVSTA